MAAVGAAITVLTAGTAAPLGVQLATIGACAVAGGFASAQTGTVSISVTVAMPVPVPHAVTTLTPTNVEVLDVSSAPPLQARAQAIASLERSSGAEPGPETGLQPGVVDGAGATLGGRPQAPRVSGMAPAAGDHSSAGPSSEPSVTEPGLVPVHPERVALNALQACVRAAPIGAAVGAGVAVAALQPELVPPMAAFGEGIACSVGLAGSLLADALEFVAGDPSVPAAIRLATSGTFPVRDAASASADVAMSAVGCAVKGYVEGGPQLAVASALLCANASVAVDTVTLGTRQGQGESDRGLSATDAAAIAVGATHDNGMLHH